MKHTIVFGAALAALLGFVRPAEAQDQAPPPDSARAAVDSVRPPRIDSVRPALQSPRPAPDSVRFAPDYVPSAVITEVDLAPATSVAAEAASVLGITVSTSGTARDTLGLLISPVIPGGAGDRGGIDPGNRLAEVNNVNLRIAPADIGRREPAEGAMRALANTLRTVRPGEWVRIRLFGGGRYRTVAIQTPRADTTAAVGAPPTGLQRVVDGLGSLRAQLDVLMQAQTASVPRDTLLRAERELGAIQRRLKAAQLAPRNIDNTVGSLPGLRVAAVASEMKDYFGEGSEGGLLVLECDVSWDPLRNGDVILRVNDEPANLDLLRLALDPQRESRIDFLRRGRYMMVTLHPRE